MAIEESKIIDLITSYKEYGEEFENRSSLIGRTRVELYREVIEDLESLLPRKSLAYLKVSNFGELTGTIVEYGGERGVLLGGGDNLAIVFTFSDRYINWSDPRMVFPLEEERVWDETGRIL